MLVMLFAMSLFSKTIMKFYGNTTNDSVATTNHPNEDRTRDHSNSYSMYILSIITNQGNNLNTVMLAIIQCQINIDVLYRNLFGCRSIIFVPYSCRSLVAGRLGIGQQLLQHCRFLSDSSKNETNHQFI